MLPLKALGKNPSLPLPASGGSRQSMAFFGLWMDHSNSWLPCYTTFLPCVCVSLLITMPVIGLGSALIWYVFISTCLCLQRLNFQIRSHSQVLRARDKAKNISPEGSGTGTCWLAHAAEMDGVCVSLSLVHHIVYTTPPRVAGLDIWPNSHTCPTLDSTGAGKGRLCPLQLL